MSGNPVRRTGLVLISWLLIFAEVITFAGCTSKNKGKVKKVARDSTWFDSTETMIYGKYKGRKFNLFNQEILGAYKDGILIRTEVVVDYSRRLDEPGNSEDVIEYYSFTGELIKSVDARELLFNRSIDDIIIGDTDVVFRMHDTVGAADRKEEKCYLVSIDPEAGTVGELKEIESVPVDNTNDFDSDNYRSYDGTWIIGEYSVSRYSTNVLNTLMITKNGKSRFVDITGDPHFTGVRFNDYIVVSETEILLVCKNNSVDFISVNLETGEVKNKDEEYSWLKKISVEGRLSSFGEKTYFKDAYGLKRINFESKKLEEVFSFNCCNANRNDLSRAELISVKDDRYVFARKVTDFDALSMNYQEALEVPEIIVLEKASKNPNAGKIILSAGTVGRIDVDYPICEAIRVFNETNGKYFVRLENKLSIRDYIDYRNAKTDDDYDSIYYRGSSELGSQLAADILSGNGPDIILYAGNYRLIHSEDYLVDLSGYIKGNNGINEADYFSNVIDAAKADGKLFYMPMNFSVEGILTDSSNVKDGQTGFTFDEYEKFVYDVCNGADPVKATRLEALCTLYSYMSDTCVNGKTADFDNEAFRTLCGYVKDNFFDGNDLEICSDGKVESYNGFGTLLREHGYNAKRQTLLGYPSMDGRGPVINIGLSIGISAFAPSSVADGAWEFIKTCMSDSIQESVARAFSNPMSINAYESTAEIALANFNKANPLIAPTDDAIIASYKNVLLSGSVIDNADPAILVVLREEVPPYFVDQKTMDEILPIINNRVTTILAERS